MKQKEKEVCSLSERLRDLQARYGESLEMQDRCTKVGFPICVSSSFLGLSFRVGKLEKPN